KNPHIPYSCTGMQRSGFELDPYTFTGKVEAQSLGTRVQLDDNPVLVPEYRKGAAACHCHTSRSDRVVAFEVLEALQVIDIAGGFDMCSARIDDRHTGEFERARGSIILQGARSPDKSHTECESTACQINSRIRLLNRARRLVGLCVLRVGGRSDE